MSFNQKSDVKKHLSARRPKTLLPFRAKAQSDIAGSSGDKSRDENRDTPILREKSGLEFYAVTPIAPRETSILPSNSADEPALKKPLA
jgi:hypothetical protein